MAATALLASTGCSTIKSKMPSLPSFAKKSKPADASKTQLTNAPPAPQLNGGAPATASTASSMPQSWTNMPVYPGTTYPQTPHPDLTVSAAQASYGAPAAAHPAVATATPTSPYGAYPTTAAPATPAYAPPAAPGYAAPQQGAYGAAPQTPAPAYAQQAAPYTPPPNPYAAPGAAPQNAANPYGNVTR
jgi:hypothetical protein